MLNVDVYLNKYGIYDTYIINGAIPVNPTSGYMINQNIRSANPPKAALQMYSSTFRLGNNSDVILISILNM